MNSAEKIIDRFGGECALARLIGKRQSTVSYWARNGTIPALWHGRLLALARKQAVDLQRADFVSMDGKENLLPAEPLVPKATH
jgi:hypothetical protein